MAIDDTDLLVMLTARRLLLKRSTLIRRYFASSVTQVIETVDQFRRVRRALPSAATLGFVPTMGVRTSVRNPIGFTLFSIRSSNSIRTVHYALSVCE